jgi:uncharacterized protein YecE (DUF72 family)
VPLKIGTAGWAIGTAAAARFPRDGSSLERYSSIFPVAEINSSFHRRHRPSTWQRWHDSVPASFRFSVKIPKEISHQRKLVDCEEPLSEFLDQANCLGAKLAVLLLQLPPKLEFDAATAERFFSTLVERTTAAIVCEPRNATWFQDDADALLRCTKIARVAADPVSTLAGASPGGWMGLRYWRLHGSPQMYRSSYADRINHYADLLLEEQSIATDVWCIFDNTASSAAISDALSLQDAVAPRESKHSVGLA